jgi:hypothetical protein
MRYTVSSTKRLKLFAEYRAIQIPLDGIGNIHHSHSFELTAKCPLKKNPGTTI